MSVGQADFMKALVAAWDAADLDTTFSDLWEAGVNKNHFPVLHEGEAGGEQAAPYCVLQISSGNTLSRMTGEDKNTKQEIRNIPVVFNIHTGDVTGDSRSSKEIAAYLADEIMKVFGGHPTQAPAQLTLDNGNFLLAQYQTDYSVREGEDNYQWVVSYVFTVDVPTTVTALP